MKTHSGKALANILIINRKKSLSRQLKYIAFKPETAVIIKHMIHNCSNRRLQNDNYEQK